MGSRGLGPLLDLVESTPLESDQIIGGSNLSNSRSVDSLRLTRITPVPRRVFESNLFTVTLFEQIFYVKQEIMIAGFSAEAWGSRR